MKSLEQALMAKQGPLASCQVKEGRFVLGMLRLWNVLYRGSFVRDILYEIFISIESMRYKMKIQKITKPDSD